MCIPPPTQKKTHTHCFCQAVGAHTVSTSVQGVPLFPNLVCKQRSYLVHNSGARHSPIEQSSVPCGFPQIVRPCQLFIRVSKAPLCACRSAAVLLLPKAFSALRKKSCGTAVEMKVPLRHWVSQGIPPCSKINRDADVVTTAENSAWLSLQSLWIWDAAGVIKCALCSVSHLHKISKLVEMLKDSKTNISLVNGAFIRISKGDFSFILWTKANEASCLQPRWSGFEPVTHQWWDKLLQPEPHLYF